MPLVRRDGRIMSECFRPTEAGLGGRVVRGAAWFAVLIVFRAVSAVLTTAILARLLTPADFGYVAMAAVATDLVAMLCVFGIPSIIVQAPRLARIDLDSVFWFSLTIGAIATLLLVAISPLAAQAFKEPALMPILCAMSTMLLLDEVSAVHFSIANRLLLVRHEIMCQITGIIVRAVLSIALALAGFGVWSLVWGSIAGRAVYALLLWWLIPFVPRLRFNSRFLRRNLRAGGSYFGCGALFYFHSNIDPAVVGRLFGVTQLGYYQTAFALPEELRSRLAVATVRILFPAFALLQSNHAAFRSGVVQSTRIFAAIVVPMGAGMALLADPIVRVLYGSQWVPVVPFLQVAALVGIVRALQAFLVNIYKAKARPDLELKIGAALVPLLLISILAGSVYGPLGVAIGLLAFSVVSLASNYPALRLIQLDAHEVLWALCPATIASMIMGAVLLWLASIDVLPTATPVVELAASVAIGVVTFLLALFLISRKTLDDFWSVLRMMRLRRI